MKATSLIAALGLLFCMPFVVDADFTATMNGFVFNPATGAFSCNVAGTGDISGASSASGTYTVVNLDGYTSHVFVTGTSRSAPNDITINGSMLVSTNTQTLASSSLETTFTKGGKNPSVTKYTVVSSGSYTAADFSDLQLDATGTITP